MMERTKLQRLQEQLKKDITLSFGKRIEKILHNRSKIKQGQKMLKTNASLKSPPRAVIIAKMTGLTRYTPHSHKVIVNKGSRHVGC